MAARPHREATSWIQSKANEFLAAKLEGVKRVSLDKALKSSTTHRHDYVSAYVEDLGNIIDMEAIRASGINFGVHPLGGAGVHYWAPIAERYGLNMTLVSDVVDPTFRFMTLDWDGKIRMDPSSKYAMQSLIALKDKFDVAVACDTDHDRHGIVTRSRGLLPPNHYLAVCIHYLFGHRPWGKQVAVGKTAVSSSMIDRVTAGLGRELYEVPVGFKYFVDGLLEGKLGFGGEESAGASFLRRDGTVWTTDKDGIIAALLAVEITATMKKDPGEIYHDLTQKIRRPAVRPDRRPGNHPAEGHAGEDEQRKHPESDPGGGEDPGHPYPRARGWPGNRRSQSNCGERLVRGAPIRHRRNLQDLRRKLSRPKAPGADRVRSPVHRKRGLQRIDGALTSHSSSPIPATNLGCPTCPDFLRRLVALIHSMRLSLMKGAHADLSSAAWQEIGVKPCSAYGIRSTQCQALLLSSRLPWRSKADGPAVLLVVKQTCTYFASVAPRKRLRKT